MSKKTTTGSDRAAEEGPRNFGVFLQKLGGGDAEIECSRELHGLMKLVKEEARLREGKIKGSLTVKFAFEVDGKDKVPVVKVTYDIATKAPKPSRGAGHFWFTEGGNLSSEAPKQSNLPFQDVAGPTGRPHDLDPDHIEAQEV